MSPYIIEYACVFGIDPYDKGPPKQTNSDPFCWLIAGSETALRRWRGRWKLVGGSSEMAIQSTRIRFSQSFVDAAHANGQHRARYWDTGVPGLVLNVTDKGAMTFAVIFRDIEGRQREPRLGDAKIVTLKQARTAALDLLSGAQLYGRDPIAERRALKAKAEARRTRTFEKLSEVYFADGERRKAPSRITLEKSSYRKHIEPRFGATPVTEMNAEAIADAIGEVAETSGYGAANTVLEVVRQTLSFGMARGWLTANAATGLKPFPKISRERVATSAELRTIWTALDAATSEGRSDSASAALAVQLATLTLQRRFEVAGLHWREVDWDGKLWTIPGPRTKNKKGPHLVPLSNGALEVLRTAFDGKEDGYAFTNRADAALDAKVMTRFFARLTKAIKVEDFTLHDLRRTGATMLTSERLSVMGEIISRILNHTPPGPAITRVYNRNTYLPQKRAALDIWAAEVKCIAAPREREDQGERSVQGR